MPCAWRRTKIVCTLGPSTDQPGILEKMIRVGIDVARVNTAHGEPAEHAGRIARVRALAADAGRPVAILVDLPGPKWRVEQLPGGERELAKGERITLADTGTGGVLPVSFPELLKQLKAGATILLSDG